VQDEESLARRIQKRDQEAFGQLYESYFDKIYRYIVFRIGSRAEAEDMTQQVFLKALESGSSFKWRGIPVSAWLFRIAHNQVVDYMRKKTKYSTVSLEPSLAGSGDNPQQAAEQKMETEQLLLALNELTQAQREVISLRFTSELPVAEVARVMDKSLGAVKALQHSAILNLRKKLTLAWKDEKA